jgi:hypothetical protein
MNIKFKIPEKIKLDSLELQKMIFIFNALEEGWQIKKDNDKYIFIKQHKNQQEIYLDKYLDDFIKNNLNVNFTISNINNH